MSKYKPEIVGNFRVCPRNHKVYVELCPWCNQPVRGEEHTDKARKLVVTVPRYRKKIVYQGKDYSKPRAEQTPTEVKDNDTTTAN